MLNQPYSGMAIERADVERHLAVQLDLSLPYDGENSLRAVNEGKPVVLLASRSPLSEALRGLAQLVSDQPDQTMAVEPQRRGVLDSLFRRG